MPVTDYQIIIAQDADSESFHYHAAEKVAEKIEQITGWLPVIRSDNTAPQTREIVIGDTNRGGAESLGTFEYSIVGKGTKVYIHAGSGLAYNGVLEHLEEIFNTGIIDIHRTVTSELAIEKEPDAIRVMTSNVLDSQTKYSYKRRAAVLADLYRTFLPDFIGLQEADKFRDLLAAELADQPYTMVNYSVGHIPFLYRNDIWQPVTDGVGATVKNAEVFQPLPNGTSMWGYQWVLFEKTDNPSVRVIMMNLHFHNKNLNWVELRADDIARFNAEVKRLESLYPNVPMFVTGDFNGARNAANSLRSEKNGEEILDGWVDIVSGTKLECSTQMTENINDIAAQQGRLIDHICANPELVDAILQRRITYELYENDPENWETTNGISDHTPYFTDFVLKP